MEDELFDFGAGEPDVVEQPVEDPELTTVYENGDFGEENLATDEQQSSDYITRLLENRGIKNRTIQVEDEDGNLQDVSFDELSDEDKYDLLSEQESPEPILSDGEINTLNYLRQNNMTLQDFANWQKQLAVEEYLNNQAPVSDFDNYSDEEMVAYDYIQRFGESMSDQEIDAAIDRLKADPEAFEKQVTLLRNAYKSEEEAQAKLYQEQEEQENKVALANFQNAYRDAAQDMNYIQGMTLDPQDKDELLHFVLDKDATGRTGMAKAMDDPKAVMAMAWYLLHGEEAFNATVQHFQKEISSRSNSGRTRAVTRQRPASKDSFQFN